MYYTTLNLHLSADSQSRTCIIMQFAVMHYYAHSKKNWSAQFENLLVHSELMSLVHYLEMPFCVQGCAPLGHFKSLDN